MGFEPHFANAFSNAAASCPQRAKAQHAAILLTDAVRTCLRQRHKDKPSLLSSSRRFVAGTPRSPSSPSSIREPRASMGEADAALGLGPVALEARLRCLGADHSVVAEHDVSHPMYSDLCGSCALPLRLDRLTSGCSGVAPSPGATVWQGDRVERQGLSQRRTNSPFTVVVE